MYLCLIFTIISGNLRCRRSRQQQQSTEIQQQQQQRSTLSERLSLEELKERKRETVINGKLRPCAPAAHSFTTLWVGYKTGECRRGWLLSVSNLFLLFPSELQSPGRHCHCL